MSVEKVLDAIILPRDIQSYHDRKLVEAMRSIAFDYRNGMVAVAWYAENNLTITSIEVAIEEDDG